MSDEIAAPCVLDPNGVEALLRDRGLVGEACPDCGFRPGEHNWQGMRDGDKLVAWLREAAEEIEKAHAYLDVRGVPRSFSGEIECTLAARISLAIELAADSS